MTKSLFLAAAALLSATPAFAHDYPQGGPRIEIRAGWDDAVTTVTYNNGTTSFKDSASKSGVTYGGEVGYDLTVSGPAFVGLYAGGDGSTTKQCIASGTERGCLGMGRTIMAGVRVGYMLGHNSAVYLKAGYSNGQINMNYSDSALPANNFKLSETLNGYHAGVGGELGITQNFYGKVEYLYTHYNVLNVKSGTETATVDLTRHQVTGGVGYRF